MELSDATEKIPSDSIYIYKLNIHRLTIYLQQPHRKHNEPLQEQGSVISYDAHEAETTNKERFVTRASWNGISWGDRCVDWRILG
jgi:hypothetical protein